MALVEELPTIVMVDLRESRVGVLRTDEMAMEAKSNLSTFSNNNGL